MKTQLSLIGGLSLATLALATQAQGLPKVIVKTVNTKDKAATERQTADHRAATYKGPKVVKNTEALGNRILRDSKPAPKSVAPAKQ